MTEFCGARRSSDGGSCRKPAGWGTGTHVGVGACRLHGGSTPSGVVAAQRVIAARAVETMGLPRNVAPHQALLEEVWRTAGRVEWLDRKVTEAGEDALFVRNGFGEMVPSEWERLLQAERRNLVAASSAAIRGGAQEAQVEIARAVGERLGAWLDAVTADLGLSREQRARAWEAGERHLSIVTDTTRPRPALDAHVSAVVDRDVEALERAVEVAHKAGQQGRTLDDARAAAARCMAALEGSA